MIINNCNRNDDGSLDFEFHVDEEEAAYLMDHAVKNLIAKGALHVEIQQAEQEFALFKHEGNQPN
jgi:hypothetical protein